MTNTERNKLVLGCGENDLGNDFVHLDKQGLEHVDVVHDLNSGELPFQSNRFSFVKARHVLEHVREEVYREVVEEVARVTEPGGLVYVVGPHHLSWNSKTPDHFRSFSRRSFDVFTPGHSFTNDFPDLFKLENIHYDFYSSKYVDEMREVYGDEAVAAHVGNAINEVVFELRVL